MANFYAKLKQSVENCDIFYLDSLSYIKQFVSSKQNAHNDSGKIILFCKEDKKSKIFSEYQENRKKNQNEKGLLDLTGSPLKDSFQDDLLNDSFPVEIETSNLWSDAEECFKSIPISLARSNFNEIALKIKEKTSPTCWAICNDSDDDTLLLSMQFKNGQIHQGIVKFNGFTEFKLIDVICLQSKHLLYAPKHSTQTNSTIDTYYDLCNSHERKMKLQISFEINGPVTQSILAKQKDSLKMTLHQSVRINNIKSVASKFWRQIHHLNTIKENIIAYKEYSDPKYLMLNITCDSDLVDLKREIYEILTEFVEVQESDDEDEPKDEEKNIDKIIKKASERESTELTDQLWEVLKRCSSYEMLKEAFAYIFTSAAKINVVNMPMSENRLAHLIREIIEQRIAIPHLAGSEPLELLLEIGIGKVSKDYEFIFTESKLCSAENLQIKKLDSIENSAVHLDVRKSLKILPSQQFNTPMSNSSRKTLMNRQTERVGSKDIVGFQNSVFNQIKIEQDIARLARIHMTLEHLILIQNQLNIGNVYTNFVDDIHKTLIPFEVLKEMEWDEREIDVSNSKILSKIENVLPNRFRVSFQSENAFKRIQNTFFYTVQSIFPPNIYQCIDSIDPTIEEKVYYSHQYLKIESL